MTIIASSVMKTLDVLSTLFVLAFFCGLVLAVGVFLLDRMQSRDAILRNYPLIGHMRYIFSALGEFFRQYFFAMDREELPFQPRRTELDRTSLEKRRFHRRLRLDQIYQGAGNADFRELPLSDARSRISSPRRIS